jgi:hypothetical protein
MPASSDSPRTSDGPRLIKAQGAAASSNVAIARCIPNERNKY